MAGHSDLFWHRPDGVGQPEQITDTAADKLTPFPNAITRDGKQVILRAAVNGKNYLFIVDVGGDRKVKSLLATEHDERNAAVRQTVRCTILLTTVGVSRLTTYRP